MNKTKKQEEKRDRIEAVDYKVVGQLIKQVTEEYPDSLIDGIQAMRHAMMIQFKALSLSHCDKEKLDRIGKELIDETHKEFTQFIDHFHKDLVKMWEEDKKERMI